MLPWGICMTLWTMSVGVLWYALFGRLQYGYATQQDLICILQAEMAAHAAYELQKLPGGQAKIPATVVAIICISAVLSGLCSVLVGKLGLGKYMLLFPTPVTQGFLGAIGVVVFRAAWQTASGVKFKYFYPTDWDQFFEPNRIAQVACMLATVFSIRQGPALLKRCFANSAAVERLGGLVCQLLPLAIFYTVVLAAGISMESLQHAGWTYPSSPRVGPLDLWTTYSPADVDWSTVSKVMPGMPALVLMSVMCTLMGALAITDKFPTGPKGDPSPMETINFDTELATVGLSSLLLGLTGGNVNFHKFSVIQLRLDGGTHRIAVLMIALFAGSLFLSGAPIGQLVPKWFLAGLFLNTGIHFLKGTLLSYRSMATFTWRGWKLPSPQFTIAPCCVVMAIFFSPAKAILTGLVLSVAIFLTQSSASSPVINVAAGDRVMSRSKRPFWEMRVLREEGDRILLLYLQGQLFFGSAQQLVAALAAAAMDEHVKFIIISLARVPRIDASAAKHLKTTADKLRQRHCEVIFCRMNEEVYGELQAAKVVQAPDEDLVGHLKNLRWKSTPMMQKPVKRSYSRAAAHPTSPPLSPFPNKRLLSPDSRAHPADWPPLLRSPIVLQGADALDDEKQTPERPLGDAPESPLPPDAVSSTAAAPSSDSARTPDAFCHETDALDYCDERIVSEFCYGESRSKDDIELEPYMLAYRASVTVPGTRLPEWAFEDMNGLPRGLMAQLRNFCEVHAKLPAWTKMSDMMDLEGALCFIMKGSVSVIQHVPLSNDLSVVEPSRFSFRQGKRLLKRFPPGHVAGKDGFFLKHTGQIIDPELEPRVVVSSKLGPPAEIWVLRPQSWETMPLNLKAALTEMICVQFSDDTQHSRLQEH
eukprot:TRINITY_DN36414_c0_g1_i1.p1 TRINITY_DN36414_c0_g1~~TRINITY_DN36414_c0_g1_i1.p1  ORF type:complete len:990 (-),score=172.96 TRINITY_DN36414_c0_g1_i1:13-2628(-)